MDPDGRKGQFWQLVGTFTSYFAANVSVFGSMGGVGNNAAPVVFNAAGTFAAGMTAGLKITAISQGLQNIFANHHASIVRSAQTITAGLRFRHHLHRQIALHQAFAQATANEVKAPLKPSCSKLEILSCCCFCPLELQANLSVF